MRRALWGLAGPRYIEKLTSMEFKPRFRVFVGIALLMCLSAVAAIDYQSPRILAICGLTALPLVEMCRRAIVTLERRGFARMTELPVLVPRAPQELADDFLIMEARLEHAPVALFRIIQEGANDSITPLNAYARRLIAPGRISDPAALYTALGSQTGGLRKIITFDTERGEERILVSINTITIHGVTQHLAALLPIESELESVALDAWQQLVHVLTHEIMNSLTPVASLSRTAHELVAELAPALPLDVSNDLTTALDAISRRANSLVSFVANYRTLTNLPAATPERIRLHELFTRLSALVTPAWRARSGQAHFTVEPVSLELMIDGNQLEQALINLLQNAAEATTDNDSPTINVSARLTRGGRLRIDVSDNGRGIPDAIIPHIFTPFYSTKSKGSGIGLAMVRQLVHGNGGTVRYVKSTNHGARFVVTF
jgi:signal transduction histidine kinase